MFETGTSHEHGFEFESEVGWPVAPANARAWVQLGGVSPDELDDAAGDDLPTAAGVPAGAQSAGSEDTVPAQPEVAATAEHEPEPPARAGAGGGPGHPPTLPPDLPVPSPGEDPEPSRDEVAADTVSGTTDTSSVPPLLARATAAVETGRVVLWGDVAPVVAEPTEELDRMYLVDDRENPTMYATRTVHESEEVMTRWDSRFEMESGTTIQAVVESDEVQQMVQEFGFTKLTYTPPLASSTETASNGKILQTTVFPYPGGRQPGVHTGTGVVDTEEQTVVGMLAWRLAGSFADGGVEASGLNDEQFMVRDTPDGRELVLADAESFRKFPEGDEYASFEPGEVRSFAHTATAEPAVPVPNPYFITEVPPGTTMLGRRGAEEGPVLVAREDDYAQIVAVYDQVTGEGALMHIRLEDFDEGTYHEPVARIMQELPSLFRTPGVAAYSFGRVGRGDVAELADELMGGVEKALWNRRVAPVPDGQLQQGDTVRFDLEQGRIHIIDRRGSIMHEIQLPEPWRRS